MEAALLLIGNELLSGKIQEANLAHLAHTLRKHGVALRRSVMVPDELPIIEAEVRALSRSYTWLFTSGGVGPTHDDVTMVGVARAYGVDVMLHPQLAAMIRARYGDRCSEGHLRMAMVPAGAALETSSGTVPPTAAGDAVEAPDEWPAVRIENTWILPGVPELDEAGLIPALEQVVAAHPQVEIGSYPKWFDPTYRTKLTFDGRDETVVRAARDAFVALLPAGEPQRIE